MTARSAGLGALIVAVVLVGLNLRAPIVGIAPLIPALSADLGLAPTTAGLLTSLPLLCFALVSPLVAPLARRLGPDGALLMGLGLLAVATVFRPWGSGLVLLAGTALVGVAVTVGNVVVPVIVRRDAGTRAPMVMAISTSAYGAGQGLTAAAAVPVADEIGWRGAMTFLAVPIVIALAVWLMRLRAARGGPVIVPAAGVPRGAVWRQVDAWWLALFFGMQATLFYSASTWLPTQLAQEASTGEELAGTALSIFHLMGITGTLAVPAVMRLLRGGVRAGIAFGALWSLFFAGLALAPELWPIWVVVGGFTQGAGIGLGLTLIAMRPVDADYGRDLSAMVQTAGYALAAAGPVLLGWVHEASGSWALVAWLCAGGGAVMCVAAPRAGAARPIGAPAGR
ncbi:MFS transporter [Georgenia halophila]|uniref:MFS transporter n=1 Tax=Georgenia halophila TaxID=620889 RepID=A0ABP8LBI8_9MICO